MTRKFLFVSILSSSMFLAGAGCIKDYDKPEYSEIDTSETGFLIPLEGDTAGQAKFASESYLEEKKVAAKRVQITHRWSPTGRFHNDGQWIPVVKLIKVKRSPVTREWTAEASRGTASKGHRRDLHPAATKGSGPVPSAYAAEGERTDRARSQRSGRKSKARGARSSRRQADRRQSRSREHPRDQQGPQRRHAKPLSPPAQ